MGKSDSFSWEKLSPETRAMLEKVAEVIVPLRCALVVGVDKASALSDGVPVLCGKPLHPALGCLEKFEWGGRHGFTGDPQKDMKFSSFDFLPRKGGSSLNLDGLEDVGGYKPHPVTDGGVGSGKIIDRKRLVVLTGDRVGAVLAFLPEKFVHAYEALVDLGYGEKRLDASGAMGAPANPRAGARRSAPRLKSSEVSKTIVSSNFGNGGTPSGVSFKSEIAVDYRRKIDRRLRRLAREIKLFLDEDGTAHRSGQRKCSGKCKKIGEPDWVYCARCGGPMIEEDEPKR